MAADRPTRDAATRRDEVREAIRAALCDMSTSSGVIVTQDGDLGVVFMDESEAYIVKLESAGLMVLHGD